MRNMYILLFFQSWIKFPFLTGGIECPPNKSSWIQRSKEMCKDSNEMYHCLPTQYLNESVEVCRTVVELIQSGDCAVYYPDRRKIGSDRLSRCYKKNFTGCPEQAYLSNETYLYPSCQKINTEESCYLADNTCTTLASNNPTDATSSDERDGTSKASQITFFCVLYSAISIWFF